MAVVSVSPEEPRGGFTLPNRPMLMAGAGAALAAAGGGLAVLVTLTAIGWITAPHVGIGGGLPGVLRSAGLLWLVAHHVEVTVRGVGRIGLLPLGLVLLPGALIERGGRWMANAGHVTQLRHVGYAALAIACPYTLFTAAVAVASRTSFAAPSLWQAVAAGFLISLVAGGLGAARGLAPWRNLVGLVPPRPRSVILGTVAALAVLIAAGAVLAGASLAVHLAAYRQAVASLSPGAGGSALLVLAGLSYLPNSVFWAIAYMLGPGFAFGVGTAVSPSGSALGAVPAFPMLAALPGVVIGFGAKVSGGPLGSGRLAAVGPAGAEVGLVAILEVGVTAALAAGAANWLILRHHIRRLAAASAADPELTEHLAAGSAAAAAPAAAAPGQQVRGTGPLPVLVVDETDDAGGHRRYYDPWAADRDSDNLT